MDGESKPGKFSSFKKKLVFFGPGLLLAITAAGEAGIADAMDIGAHFGMALVWVVFIALLFKYAFTTGIARYTLATGNTIFQGLVNIPGPKNWAAILTMAAYFVDSIAIGAMILFAGTFLDYLIPGSYPFYLICLLILLLSLVILRTHIYHHFEKIMALIVIIVGITLIVFMIQYPYTFVDTAYGLIPSIPHDSEKEILAIIGAVGSGLMLMLYSVWLEKKIRVRNADPSVPASEKFQIGNKKKFREYITSVRIDILVGFILVAIFTIGFMAVGNIGHYLSFIPHGTELTLDLMLSMVLKLYHAIPYGNVILSVLICLVFFGATVIGMDARASAVTKIVKSMREKAGHPVKNSSLVYNICLLCFSLITAVVLLYNQPLKIMLYVSLICAIFFGIFGFILIYLDSKLPEYARGNRFWVLFIGIGSILSIYLALVLEGSILGIGISLAQKMAIVLVAIFFFTRSRMFKRLVKGTANVFDKFWLIAIFGTISVIGTVWGISADTYIINFRDLGAILAGIIGGPVVGGIVGVIGGIYRYTMGGVTAIPCCIATLVAGVLSGFLIRYRKGKLTYVWAAVIAVAAECSHLLFIFPTYSMLTHAMTASAVLDVIRNTILPMSVSIALGCVCFAWFTREVPVFKGALQRFSFRQEVEDARTAISDMKKIREEEEREYAQIAEPAKEPAKEPDANPPSDVQTAQEEMKK